MLEKIKKMKGDQDATEILAKAEIVNPIIDKLNTLSPTSTSLVADTISESTSATGVTIDGVLLKDGSAKLTSVIPATAYGTAGTGVTVVEYTNGREVTAICSFTNVSLGAPTAGGSSAHGKLIYTLPNSMLLVKSIAVKVGLTVGTTTTDTPDVGLGTVIATGAVAVLSGTGTFEDIITGQTWNKALDGTVDHFATLFTGVVTEATTVPLIPAAGAGTAIHLNAADGWAAGVTGNLTASGLIAVTYTIVV